MRIMVIPDRKEREKGTESLLEEVIDENFQNLSDPQIKANNTSGYLSAKRPPPVRS